MRPAPTSPTTPPLSCVLSSLTASGSWAGFFDPALFFVVEVDQRGTGSSQPSVRDSHTHMQRYLDISIAQMSADFETARAHLGIERWLVFGGSWGSTLGLDYAERYPSRCLGLIVRGIYLNTKPEFDAIYSRSPFLNNARRLAEFVRATNTAQELTASVVPSTLIIDS